MAESDDYATNRLALSAMRQALGFLHRDDHYFDRMYGGAIAQTALDGSGPQGEVLHRFRRILQDTDDKINEIAARAPRDEVESLAKPIVRHDLTDKEAHDLDALHLAMHIFHHGRWSTSGEYEKGMVIECMLEDPELKNQFFGILHEMEQCIHYERRPSTDPDHQVARLTLPFVQQRKVAVVPARTPKEEEEALNERLKQMAREARQSPKLP